VHSNLLEFHMFSQLSSSQSALRVRVDQAEVAVTAAIAVVAAVGVVAAN
jgi:hypothetical protein